MATFHVQQDEEGGKRLIIERVNVAAPYVSLDAETVSALVLFLQNCGESWKA